MSVCLSVCQNPLPKECVTLYDKLNKYYTEVVDKNQPAEDTTSSDNSNIWAGHNHPLGPCPTLMHCLGHQACLFHYNNKFCQNDAFPGARKHIKVRFTCYDDHHHDSIKSEIIKFLSDRLLISVNGDLGSLERYHLNVLTDPISALSSSTVFLKYKTKVRRLVPPEKQLIDEEQVFETGCPPVEDALDAG